MPRLPLALLAGIPAALACLLLAASCTKDDADDVRRGLTGDSCTKTDDCAVPLRCLKNVCTAPPGGGTTTTGSGGGSSPDAGTWGTCDKCLETQCGTAQKACGDDCHAIEACIEMVCANLSKIGSSDEGKCQADCQSKHAAGKDQHLAVVDCAVGSSCEPPCTPYPQSYEDCRAYMDKNLCASQLAACKASADCSAYQDCVTNCTSLADCLACDDTPEKLAGRQILEVYERCVAGECIAQSWIP
jgi:hypothetical protein